MGVGKALHRAEQKQRCAEPPQHTEHRWDAAGELEEIMNVIQHHQRQCNGFELGTVQPVFQFCQHTNSPFNDAIIVTGKSVGILRENLFFQIIAHQIRGAALCMAHGLVFDALIGEAQHFQLHFAEHFSASMASTNISTWSASAGSTISST